MKSLSATSLLLGCLVHPWLSIAQGPPEPIPLWPGTPPHAMGDGPGHAPTLTVFLPDSESATRAAVVVCPGGGYGNLAGAYEGEDVASWLTSHGIAGIVLRYRHAPAYGHPVPLTDALRAIRTVRARSAEWRIDPARIGILGFSAGGHLAATAGTLYEPGDPGAPDAIERETSRPDFLVLVYPVITMSESHSHEVSKRNLLGESPEPTLMERLSPDRQVNGGTPPAFLVHTADDQVVDVKNSVRMYQSLVEHGVAAELHAFETGPHGFGLGGGHASLSMWPDLLLAWLRTRAIIE